MISLRRPLAAALAGAFLFAATACGGDDASTLTLTARSSSGEAEVVYRLDDGERVTETVATPWEYTVDVGGSFSLDLEVVNLTGSGTVACGIEYAASSMSNPTATGEAAADCYVSGSSRGGTFTMSSTSSGTPFEEAAPAADTDADTDPDLDTETETVTDTETDTDETAAEIPEGMSAALLFTDRDGEPIEPAQFDRVYVSIVVGGALGADEVQVLVEGEIDDGVSVFSLNDRERHDADDVDATGRLVHVLRSFDLAQPGPLRAEFSGEVKIDDVVIPVDDRVEVDVAPTEVVVEPRVLSDGFVTLDVATVAITLEDVPARRSTDSSESEPFDIGDLRGIAGVEIADADVAVFQVVRPLATTVDEVADVIEAFFAEAAETERSAPGEIDGRETIRFDFVGDRSGTVDVLMVDGEIVFVQTRWSSTGSDARAVRDSIRFDPTRLLPPES